MVVARHEGPALADQKVQIHPLVGLQNMVDVQFPVAAGQWRWRRGPAGQSACQLGIADVQVQPAIGHIELNVPERKLHLHISDDELARRLAKWTAPVPPMTSGYWKLYIDHVLQADEGVDLDFLVGQRGSAVPRDNH